MNIICDLDGVVIEYDFPTLIGKYFGVRIAQKDIHAYSLEDCLGVGSDVVREMFSKEVHNKPLFVPGAINALTYFMSRDWQVYILTNRLYFMSEEALERFLDLYCIPYTGIINGEIPDYASFHIDDSPQKLMDTRERTRIGHSLLFSRLWNKKCKNITGELERVRNWKEIKERIVYEER